MDSTSSGSLTALKNKSFVTLPIRIKVHITGFACAYEDFGGARPKRDPGQTEGRYQGSLYNQQKHAIADAIEWMRCNAVFKPRIFVVTSPGYLNEPAEGRFIQKLTANLRDGYGMKNYVWVRELTKKGYPHFHFVADVDEFDAVKLSLYWSGLYGVYAKNSIRLGTRPDHRGKRRFWVSGPRMCWYMSKYIGKDLESDQTDRPKGTRKPYRTFAISQEARFKSQPIVYQSIAQETYSGIHQRTFLLDLDNAEEGQPTHLNPHNFSWRWTGHGQTYIGFSKK